MNLQRIIEIVSAGSFVVAIIYFTIDMYADIRGLKNSNELLEGKIISMDEKTNRKIEEKFSLEKHEFIKETDVESISRYLTFNFKNQLRGEKGDNGEIGKTGSKGEAGLTREDVEKYIDSVISKRLNEIKEVVKNELTEVRVPIEIKSNDGGCIYFSRIKSGDTLIMNGGDNFCKDDGENILRVKDGWIASRGKPWIVIIKTRADFLIEGIKGGRCISDFLISDVKEICLTLMRSTPVAESSSKYYMKVDSIKK